MPIVLAVLELRDGALRKASFDAVAAARQLADALGASVQALCAGAPPADAAAALGAAGADALLVAEHAAFAL
ncbi:MAG: hypothetical protein NW201_10595, partial [Gemmatimonadales bacterium]|nr:hypothetical protein [Gemmatimonadales bacterium]